MAVVENGSDVDQSTNSSYNHNQQQVKVTSLQPPAPAENGYNGGGGGGGDGFKMEIRDLEEMLSKLNPMAEEFIPNQRPQLMTSSAAHFGYAAVNNFLVQTNNTGFANGTPTRRKGNFSHGKRRMNSRTSMAQRDDVIKRTVYVSDIDQQVTEEQLAALFVNCGQVVDCRVCGDPNSVLHFAFIEFTDEEGARNALTLSGTMLGYYPVRVLPSKTAIAPVNPTFYPSLKMRGKCVQELFTALTLIRRLLRQMSNSSLKHSVARFIG